MSSSFDMVAGFFRVVGSAVGAKAKATLVTLAGIQGNDPNDQTDQGGEVAEDRLMFHALGLLARPMSPKVINGKELHADVVALRTADGAIPIAWHDPRIDAAFPNGLAEGQIALAGYKGGFHSIALTPDQSSNIHVIYAPYNFDGNDVAQKAHAIVLDTTAGNESVQLVHGDGYFLTASAGKGWTMAVDGATALALTPGSGPGVSGKLTVAANLAVGGGATFGDPMAALPAAIAQYIGAYISQLETDIAAGFTAVGIGAAANGPAGATAFGLHAAARAAIVAQIPAPNTTVS